MVISIDTVLTVGGLLVTLILGYLGLKYTLKYRKKTEITFLKDTNISLFETIVKNIDDIEIKYKGEKINENLILFKGTFFNNGNIDIEKSIIHKPLEIELPENYKWVMYKLIDSSEGLEINLRLTDNKLVFQWDLLKEGEYFTFDSLVEYQTEKNDTKKNDIDNYAVEDKLLKNIKFNHRITDLKNVSKENSIPKPMGLGFLIFMSIYFLGIVATCLYFSFGQLFFPKYEVLTEVNIQSGKQFVTLTADNKNSITLLDKDGNKIATYLKTELLPQEFGTTIQIGKAKINYWRLCILGFFAIVFFIFWIVMAIEEIRGERLYKKIKEVADKHEDLYRRRRRRRGILLY